MTAVLTTKVLNNMLLVVGGEMSWRCEADGGSRDKRFGSHLVVQYHSLHVIHWRELLW